MKSTIINGGLNLIARKLFLSIDRFIDMRLEICENIGKRGSNISFLIFECYELKSTY